jgi:hypothetical protein
MEARYKTGRIVLQPDSFGIFAKVMQNPHLNGGRVDG